MQNILKNAALNGTKRGIIMSREIKFRIWDKINKMWLKSFNVNLLNRGNMKTTLTVHKIKSVGSL